jgi:hypothetical protein
MRKMVSREVLFEGEDTLASGPSALIPPGSNSAAWWNPSGDAVARPESALSGFAEAETGDFKDDVGSCRSA